MKPFTVFLVRHGEAETQWGNDDDPGLSQNGIDQAQNLIKSCLLYTSDAADDL